MGTKFDILWKPPPSLVDNKDEFRWFYRVCECLNGGVAGSTTYVSSPIVQNTTGTTIKKGTVCAFVGASNGTIDVAPFIADGTMPSFAVLGIAAEDIKSNETGYLMAAGELSPIDLTGYAVGDILYASPTVAGAVTNVRPSPPAYVVVIGAVITAGATGKAYIRIAPQLRPAYGTFVYETGNQAGVPAGTPVNWGVARISRGVRLGTTDATKIVCLESGLFTFAHSLELRSSNAAAQVASFWIRRLPTEATVTGPAYDVQSTARTVGIASNVIPVVPAWSYTFSMAAGEVYQMMWAAPTTLSLQTNTTPPAPLASAAAITVTQVSQ